MQDGKHRNFCGHDCLIVIFCLHYCCKVTQKVQKNCMCANEKQRKPDSEAMQFLPANFIPDVVISTELLFKNLSPKADNIKIFSRSLLHHRHTKSTLQNRIQDSEKMRTMRVEGISTPQRTQTSINWWLYQNSLLLSWESWHHKRSIYFRSRPFFVQLK